MSEAKDLQLEIISPEGTLFSDKCHLAVVPSILGDIGVMHGHEIVVLALRPGQVSVYDNKHSLIKSFDIESGFAKMQTADKLVVLIS